MGHRSVLLDSFVTLNLGTGGCLKNIFSRYFLLLSNLIFFWIICILVFLWYNLFSWHIQIKHHFCSLSSIEAIEFHHKDVVDYFGHKVIPSIGYHQLEVAEDPLYGDLGDGERENDSSQLVQSYIRCLVLPPIVQGFGLRCHLIACPQALHSFPDGLLALRLLGEVKRELPVEMKLKTRAGGVPLSCSSDRIPLITRRCLLRFLPCIWCRIYILVSGRHENVLGERTGNNNGMMCWLLRTKRHKLIRAYLNRFQLNISVDPMGDLGSESPIHVDRCAESHRW